jgi:rubrerythrin
MSAAPELLGVQFSGVTRGAFILRGALAVGAVYGVDAVGPYVSRAFGAASTNDVDILNFALTLENIEAAFYKAAVARATLSGKADEFARSFGGHEAEHVKALTQLVTQLGGKPAAAPATKFSLGGEASFLKLAVTLEETGISAYNGAATAIQSPDLLAAAGSIVQIEARHAGALRMVAGRDPAPIAFDKSLTPPQVAAAVKPFLA